MSNWRKKIDSSDEFQSSGLGPDREAPSSILPHMRHRLERSTAPKSPFSLAKKYENGQKTFPRSSSGPSLKPDDGQSHAPLPGINDWDTPNQETRRESTEWSVSRNMPLSEWEKVAKRHYPNQDPRTIVSNVLGKKLNERFFPRASQDKLNQQRAVGSPEFERDIPNAPGDSGQDDGPVDRPNRNRKVMPQETAVSKDSEGTPTSLRLAQDMITSTAAQPLGQPHHHRQGASATQRSSPAMRNNNTNASVGRRAKKRQPSRSGSVQARPNAGPMPLTSLNLQVMQRTVPAPRWTVKNIPAPRPNKSFIGSSRKSFPSVSTWHSGGSRNGQETLSSQVERISDIRSTAGLQHNLYHEGNNGLAYNVWADPEDDSELRQHSYVQLFVNSWMESIPDGVCVNFLDQDLAGHWRRDIDSAMGSLIEPVVYPDTFHDPKEYDEQTEWRRNNWSSEVGIRRVTLARRRKDGLQAPDLGPPRRNRGAGSKSIHGDVETPDAKGGYLTSAQRCADLPCAARVHCYLRPARKDDMKDVAAIYNWEMQHGTQSLDVEPLTSEDFEKILEATTKSGLLFIVAVNGNLQERTEEKSAVESQKHHPELLRRVPKPITLEPREKVLGFTYLSPWEPGLAGAREGTGRFSAKLFLFVGHEYRRKMIGHALLDKMLGCISDPYQEQGLSDWNDPSDSILYKRPIEGECHKRLYNCVYINFLVRHHIMPLRPTSQDGDGKDPTEEHEKDLQWIKEMLSSFRFSQKARFEFVHRVKESREGGSFWLDSVIFEHRCHQEVHIGMLNLK